MNFRRLRGAFLPLCLVLSLSGCGILRERVESNIDDSFENVLSELCTLSLDKLSEDSASAREAVGKLASHKGGDAKKTEKAITASLQNPQIAPVDKAYLTYQLARCQMFGAGQVMAGSQDKADATFRQAIPLAEALEPPQPGLLEAAYYGYSVCLKKQGRKEESQSYKAKYQALSAAEAKKRKAKEE